MNKEFFEALDVLERERHIPKSYMIEKVEAALTTACKKELGASNITVVIDPEKCVDCGACADACPVGAPQAE